MWCNRCQKDKERVFEGQCYDCRQKARSKERRGELLFQLFVLLVFLSIIGLGISQPYFEARAFNKFTTGPKATYWDAVWSSLRVTAR